MSSGSESDEDYTPGEPEQLSEEESANEETDQQYQNEVEQKVKKRKRMEESEGKKYLKTRNGVKEIRSKSPEIKDEIEAPVNAEEEKKKEDDLWAKFLEGTDTKSRPTTKETSSVLETPKPNKVDAIRVETSNKIIPPSNDKTREQRIFEFAGETIVVENNKIKEKIKTAENPVADNNPIGTSYGIPGKAGGLSNVLGQLNKKNKLSTLEKSKLDWSTYKQEKNLEDEIQSHNKGKNGYLDRRDFLERADLRQYEMERDLRTNRRSHR